jgi:hypothetical protein
MPRISLKQLLFAMTAIAVGLGLCWFALHSRQGGGLFIWMSAGVIYGAGFGSLFKHPIICAALGFALQFGIMFYWYVDALGRAAEAFNP